LVFILVIGLIGAGTVPASGGESSEYARRAGQPDELKLNGAYFKGYLSDAGAVLTSPLSWGATGWLKFSVVLAATYAFSSEEGDLQAWVQESRSEDLDMVYGYVGHAGSGRYVFPALGLLYGVGRISGSTRATRTALLGLESVVISGLFTGTIKYLTHKHRPSPSVTEETPWHGPGFSNAHLSFPSGHSTVSFAMATIIASEYGDYPMVTPLVYCAASLTALSRVNHNAHWMPDIILGSAIGHFTARVIASRHDGSRASNLSIQPTVRTGGVGLTLSYNF
jgi:membrane-associated phospholipid phosphatase